MNYYEAKKCLKENLKGYKLQRTNEVFTTLGLHDAMSTYVNFASSIGMVSPDSAVGVVMGFGASAAAMTLAITYLCNDNTVTIDTLKRLKSKLNSENNILVNVSKEDFEKSLAKRRTR